MKWDWRKLVVIFLAVGVVAGAGGYFSGKWLLERVRADQFRQNAGRIQLAIEKYAVDHEGGYPVRIQDLITANYLQDWPDNPYSDSGEPMLPIPAGSPAQDGDFVYVTFGPVIFVSPLEDPTVNAQGQVEAAVRDAAATAPVSDLHPEAGLEQESSEVDQYLLVFYGPGGEAAEMTQFSAVQMPEMTGIDWDRVALVLTAGAG